MKSTGESRSKGQIVYNQIKEKIIRGIFVPGQELTEMELCEIFAASRTPIKNALVKLEADGFVTYEHNKGFRVSVITFQFASEVLDTRTALESHALRICCRRKDPELIEQCYRLLLRQKQQLSDGDLDGFVETDVEFHRLLIEGSGNTIWLSFWERVMDHIRRIMTVCLKDFQIRESAVEVHQRLIQCITYGDEVKVTKEIVGHFDDLRQDFMETIIE